MSEERQKVLEMLAEGRLTPEQADRLLEALGTAGQGAPRPQPEPRQNPQGDQPRGPEHRQHGFLAGLTADQLIEMRQHGVNPAFVQEIRSLGFRDISVDQLIELRDHGVTPDFIQGMRRMGFTDFDIDHLIELRDHGVNADFIQEMRELGLTEMSIDKLIELRDNGVNADYIREMRDLHAQQAFRTDADVPVNVDVPAGVETPVEAEPNRVA
jgi:bla regulator protein blaR1